MSDPFHDMSEGAKHLVDLLSVTALLGVFVEMLPHIASLLTVIWMAIRISETDRVRDLITKWRSKP